MAKPSELKSHMMVRVSLSLAVQTELLPVLSKVLAINESYSKIHVITMRPSVFGLFMAEVAKMSKPPTWKQLNIETIDICQEPRRTLIKYDRMPFDEVEIRS